MSRRHASIQRLPSPPDGIGHEQGDNQVLGKFQAITVASHRLLAGTMLSLVLASVPLAPAVAQDSLTNTVTVTPAASVIDADTGNNTDSAAVDVLSAVDYNFCPANGENFGLHPASSFWRYGGNPGGVPERIPELQDEVFTDQNADALMVDPARNRLLYIQGVTSGPDTGTARLRVYDADNGGWVTGAVVTPHLAGAYPQMAAMTSDGTGYLVAADATGSSRLLRFD